MINQQFPVTGARRRDWGSAPRCRTSQSHWLLARGSPGFVFRFSVAQAYELLLNSSFGSTVQGGRLAGDPAGTMAALDRAGEEAPRTPCQGLRPLSLSSLLARQREAGRQGGLACS